MWLAMVALFVLSGFWLVGVQQQKYGEQGLIDSWKYPRLDDCTVGAHFYQVHVRFNRKWDPGTGSGDKKVHICTVGNSTNTTGEVVFLVPAPIHAQICLRVPFFCSCDCQQIPNCAGCKCKSRAGVFHIFEYKKNPFKQRYLLKCELFRRRHQICWMDTFWRGHFWEKKVSQRNIYFSFLSSFWMMMKLDMTILMWIFFTCRQ